MLKEILERYLNVVAPKVNMKEEKELAEKYLMELSILNHNTDLEKAN